jgi:hypothetical protein
VVNTFEIEGIDDAALVGHSYGGVVITGVSSRLPGRIPRSYRRPWWTGKTRRLRHCRSFGNSEPSTPRDLALPNVAILEQLVVRVVETGKDQSWGDVANGLYVLQRQRCHRHLSFL